MARVTTNQIRAEKALEGSCGQQCVDWAIGLVEEGRDGDYLLRLAGMLPPFNHFEIARIRDRVLDELKVGDISASDAITNYSLELFSRALRDELDLLDALTQVKELCVANGLQDDIMDFYLLYYAYTDLQCDDVQWYWDGAFKENIVSIIRQRAQSFVDSHHA